MAELSYLFTAHFADGTFIQQTEEDVSSVDPTKNAFFDVLQRIDEVISFGIGNDEHTYAVDLRDGHFELDSVPFGAENPTVEIPEDAKRRLIFFKRHIHTFEQCGEQDHSVDYHIGFQTTIDGENYKQTISVR